MTSCEKNKGRRSTQMKMKATEETGVNPEPAFIPLPLFSVKTEYTAMSHDNPTDRQAKENNPFIEIRKEDIDMIEKAAEVLDARSKAFQPRIEYLAISDSPLSLVKNAKNAFEQAMNSALLQTEVRKDVGECKVKARTRLQNKFSSDEGVQTFVTVNSNLGEAFSFNPDVSEPPMDFRSRELDKNLSTSQVQNFSCARSDVSDLGCMPSAVTAPSSGVLQNQMHSYSSFVNDEPLDLTSPRKSAPPSKQMLSTSTIACDVLQAMVDCAADDLAKAKKPDESVDGKTIEIHLYSEPKSVIQHRNRCIKNSQVEQIKGQAKERTGTAKDGSLTNIQWLGNMTSDTLVKGQQGRRMYITEKQIQKVQKQCGSTERPPYSYLHLIQMAINSKPDRRMTLREIYEWMETTFPYFKHSAKPGWKNSIRHNLSLYDIFVRETRVVGGEKKKKASFWTLNVPEVFEEEDAENEEKTSEISMTAVRKYRSTPRAICPKPPIPQPPLVYSDVVVGVPPSQQQPGHIPLLPKPSGDTYTLIPVKGIPSMPSTVHSILPSCTLTSPNQIQTGEDSNSYQGIESSMFINNSMSFFHSDACMETGPTEFTHLKRRHDSSKQLTTSSKQPRIFSPITPGFQYNSCEYDSGIDLRSMYEKSSCSDFSPLPVEETKQKRIRAPRKPRPPRKSKKPMKISCKENEGERKQNGVEENVLTGVESGVVSSLEAVFTSPLQNMLNTPPRKDMLATSTPMRSNYLSPKWYSPVSFQTVTPVRNASLAPNTYDILATPSMPHLTDLSFGFSVSPRRNSPQNFKMKGRSLGMNISDNSFTGMTGLTPLKPKDANISGLSVNDSLGKILGDIQFDDNLLEDGGVMPFVDVKDISWLNH